MTVSSPTNYIAIIIVVATLLPVFSSARPFLRAASPPSTRPSAEAIELVKRVLPLRSMTLASAASGPESRFVMHYLTSVPQPNGAYGYQGLLVCDGNHAAMTVRTADGLYYRYIGNGVELDVDADQPDVLVLTEGVWPAFQYSGEPTKSALDCQFGYDPTGPNIKIDLCSFVQCGYPKLYWAHYSQTTGSLTFQTGAIRTVAILNSNAAVQKGFPVVNEWTHRGGDSVISMMFSPITPSAEDYLQLTKAQLVRRGIKFRQSREGEERLGMPSSGFGRKPSERQAAAVLGSLFKPKPSTRASKPDTMIGGHHLSNDDCLHLDEFIRE